MIDGRVNKLSVRGPVDLVLMLIVLKNGMLIPSKISLSAIGKAWRNKLKFCSKLYSVIFSGTLYLSMFICPPYFKAALLWMLSFLVILFCWCFKWTESRILLSTHGAQITPPPSFLFLSFSFFMLNLGLGLGLPRRIKKVV